MKILIDADGSPVRHIVEELAEKYHIELIIVCNIHHAILSAYGKVITVDSGNDITDQEIIKRTQENDLIITQDYGLASILLLKKAYVLNQDGWFYTNDNIDTLLLQRHLSQKMRKANRRHGQIAKRIEETNHLFKKVLEDFLNK